MSDIIMAMLGVCLLAGASYWAGYRDCERDQKEKP